MSKWYVRFRSAPALGEHEVEAADRWGAVVAVAEKLGIAPKVKMQSLFDDASVKKVEPRRVREWRVE